MLPKFWWVMPMNMKYNTQSLSKKINSGSRGRVLQLADLGFKICPKIAKECQFLAVWMSRMFVEGALDPILGHCVVPFWGQKWPKSALKACFFKSHLPLVCLTAMHCFGHCCGDE